MSMKMVVGAMVLFVIFGVLGFYLLDKFPLATIFCLVSALYSTVFFSRKIIEDDNNVR